MMRVTDQLRLSGKPIEDLSAGAGIPLERMRAIAAGAEPNLDELRRIASMLRLRLSDFTSRAVPPTSVLFRRTANRVRTGGEATAEYLSNKVSASFELLDDKLETPLKGRFEGEHRSFEDARKDAVHFRDTYFNGEHLSPLIKLPQIASEELHVVTLLMNSRTIDGASAVVGGIPFVFVSRRFPPRMLFTLAHELGHLVAHHDFREDFAVMDDEGIDRPTSRYADERFANAFAGLLLIPDISLHSALATIKRAYGIPDDPPGDIEILYVAQIYGVSFQVAAKRCEDIGVLPRGGGLSLYEVLIKRHGSPEKRAAELGLPARPEIMFPAAPQTLLASAVAKIKNGEISLGYASEALETSIEFVMQAHRDIGRTSSA